MVKDLFWAKTDEDPITCNGWFVDFESTCSETHWSAIMKVTLIWALNESYRAINLLMNESRDHDWIHDIKDVHEDLYKPWT